MSLLDGWNSDQFERQGRGEFVIKLSFRGSTVSLWKRLGTVDLDGELSQLLNR